MNYTRVEMTDGQVSHVQAWSVFLDSSGTAVCGKSPWPARWQEASVQNGRPLCLDCLQVLRKAH